jgi:hypothetical protein
VKIAVVQSRINGCWGYCPVSAVALLRPELDDEAEFLTAGEAIAAARRNPTVPRRAVFVEVTP